MTEPTAPRHQPPWQLPEQPSTSYYAPVPPEPFTQTSRFVPLPEYPSPSRRRWVKPVVVSLALLLVGAGVFLILTATPVAQLVLPPGKTALRVASESCGNVGDLADGDRTLFLNMAGSDLGSGALSRTDVLCVLAALHTPAYVTTAMGQTRALDGRQSQTWDDFEASWTYHPDDGLDVLIREH